MPILTEHDQVHLQTADAKFSQLRDATWGVISGHRPGFLAWGRAGVGKSFTVRQTLSQHSVEPIEYSARISGRALVESLQEFHESIHLVEDAESIFDDPPTVGLLRSALWSPSNDRPKKRLLTWSVYGNPIQFTFTGGLIIVSQRDLSYRRPELQALKSRVASLHVQLTRDECKVLIAV
jgi:hypothetical protein